MYIFFLIAVSILYRGEQKKQVRIAWLMLPATNLEKFLVRWIYMLAFSLATPDELVDENWDKDFLKAPLLTLWGLINIARAGKTEANVRLSALARMFHGILPQKKHKNAITKSKQKRQ